MSDKISELISEGFLNAKIRELGEQISIDYAGKFNALKQGLLDIASRAKTAAVSLGTTLWNALKTVGSAAKDAAISLAKAGVEALKAGEKVQLVGFGSFELKEKPAREVFNPLTKQKQKLAACKVPAFKIGKAFKALF